MRQSSPNSTPPLRSVRSFVRREGRLTPGQRRALDTLWPLYGLSWREPLEPEAVFGRRAPLTLEIGFGNGASLVEMAAQDPAGDFIGVEVHRPGVGRLLAALRERALGNVRVYCHDATEVLEKAIPDASLDRVLLFFPDPWPKKRHHKRRILQPGFVRLIGAKLRPGGRFHMATDWEPYAQHMLQVMDAAEAFVNCQPGGGFAGRPDYRPVTRFEHRGRRLGHAVRDLIYRRA